MFSIQRGYYYKFKKNFNDLLLLVQSQKKHNFTIDFYQDIEPDSFWIYIKENVGYLVIPQFTLQTKKSLPTDAKEISLNNLILSTISLVEDENRTISKSIIVKTSDVQIFSEIIQGHYSLQKGEVFYCKIPNKSMSTWNPFSFNPKIEKEIWFIKIVNPSLWFLLSKSDFDENYKIYNQYKMKNNNYHPSLYIEYGSKLKDKEFENKLNFKEGILLLNTDGTPETYDPAWQGISDIIEVDFPDSQILEPVNDLKITIKPKFYIDQRNINASLWKVEKLDQLKKILLNESHANLDGFKAWYSNEQVYIYALPQANTGLKSIFNDAFEKYICLEKRVFFPYEKALIPRLPESNILKNYQARGNDFLLFDDNEQINVIKFSMKSMKKLSEFIEYFIESKLNTFTDFQSQWHFNFTDLKKKPLIIEMQLNSSKDIVYKKNNQLVNDSVNKAKIPVYRDENVINKSEILSQIREIDSQLAEDIYNSELWKNRSELSFKINNDLSAIIASFTSLILKDDTSGFFEAIKDSYSKELSSFFEEDIELTEENKGEILNNIRKSVKYKYIEINFSLELFFSVKFKNQNVYSSCIELMRKGYHNSNRKFYEFEDLKIDNNGSDLENSGKTDLKVIKEDINNLIKKSA
ncbi:MAG: hypothetical protein H7263_02750, partial [Candidatus Sericytochromatia bacterium]|nr:hypothetical protein [Candidatus Sericytochromatia bacterium]